MAEQIMTPYQIDLWLKEKIDQLQTQVGSGDLSGVLSTISTIQTTLGNKVDKVAGKGLSTNDFTTTLKTKLDGIETGAEKNKVSSVNTKTGAVVLGASDVGARASNWNPSYEDITGTKPPTNAEKNPDIATEAEAKAGTNNAKMMTALRVKQSIAENASSSKLVLDGGQYIQGAIYLGASFANDYSLNKMYLINIIFYDDNVPNNKVHYQFMLTPNKHNIKAMVGFLTFDDELLTNILEFQLATNEIQISSGNSSVRFGESIVMFDRITIIEL